MDLNLNAALMGPPAPAAPLEGPPAPQGPIPTPEGPVVGPPRDAYTPERPPELAPSAEEALDFEALALQASAERPAAPVSPELARRQSQLEGASFDEQATLAGACAIDVALTSKDPTNLLFQCIVEGLKTHEGPFEVPLVNGYVVTMDPKEYDALVMPGGPELSPAQAATVLTRFVVAQAIDPRCNLTWMPTGQEGQWTIGLDGPDYEPGQGLSAQGVYSFYNKIGMPAPDPEQLRAVGAKLSAEEYRPLAENVQFNLHTYMHEHPTGIYLMLPNPANPEGPFHPTLVKPSPGDEVFVTEHGQMLGLGELERLGADFFRQAVAPSAGMKTTPPKAFKPICLRPLGGG